MPDVKHHFIPQFLLRAWADTKGDKKVEVFQLNLPCHPSSRTNPKFTGYEDNLYTLSKPIVAGVNQQAVEKKLLQRIDSEGARVLRMLSTSGFADLEPKDLGDWAYFIVSLLFRTPDAVSWLRTEAPNHLRASLSDRPEEYESKAEIYDPSTLTDFVEKHLPGYIEDFGMISLDKVICDRDRVQKLLQMKWSLRDFSGQENHLLLADRPCILTTGIDDPDLVIVLPIGPWKMFIAAKDEQVVHSMGRQHPKELLTWINEISLSQAEQRVYARDASPRRFIFNRLTKWRSY